MADADPLVDVLLATYNGELYLREQIDSVLAQTYQNLHLVIRDDGSSDGTCALLVEYRQRFPERISLLLEGPPTGSSKGNFQCLMRASKAPYAAFCDQDDVWRPDKIATEMGQMGKLEGDYGSQTPLLVFTDLAIVDNRLATIHESMWRHQRFNPAKVNKLNSLLMQNVVTGCTAFVNRALLALAVNMPEAAYMHDWWIALVACIFGKSAWCSETTVLYRQHDKNVLGASLSGKTKGVPHWRYHEKRRAQWEITERQAEALLDSYRGSLTREDHATIAALLQCGRARNRVSRVAGMLRHRFFLSNGLRANMAIAWYLWDMAAAKAHDEGAR